MVSAFQITVAALATAYLTILGALLYKAAPVLSVLAH
jgi:hypothetical protein